ncbi:MAG: glycosyltransferase family 39 protein [Chloroflexota bacterium]
MTLFAFALRVYRLDAQSYWIDEGLTVFYANLSLAELMTYFQTVRATPPLYHALTIYWVDLFGDGEFSLRYFSLMFSVLAVPLVYGLGRSLGGRELGLLTACLFAVAPYQIWHAQDARNYSMMTAAAAMSFWGFINLWRYGGWRWWLIYVIGTEWGIMIHYHGLIVIGVQGLFFLLTWQKHVRYYLAWAGTLVIILAPFVTWLIFGSRLWQGNHWLPYVALGESYVRSAIAYGIGELVPRSQAIGLTLIFVGCLGVGTLYAWRRSWGDWQGREMGAFLLAFLLAPNLATWVYSYFRTPVYLERYLIPVQIGYLLVVAIGVMALARLPSRIRFLQRIPTYVWSIIFVTPLVLVSGWVLQHHYSDPVYAKPSWRQVADLIDEYALPGDAIVMTGDGGELLFDFYYAGSLPVYDDFNTPVPTVLEAQTRMAEIAANHSRIWYTAYGVEIDAALERWLAENSYPAWHSWLGRKQLALYGAKPSSFDRVVEIDHPFLDEAGIGPYLTTIRLLDQPIIAGDVLPLQLTWLTENPIPQNLKLSIRLINSRGDQFNQSDWPPLSAQQETTTWPVNMLITDQRSVWIPADAPPGTYALQLVVYDPVSGRGFGHPAIVDEIEVASTTLVPPLSALSIPNAKNQAFGNLDLVGHAAPTNIIPGQPMWLWLYWQAQDALDPETVIRFELQSEGEVISHDVSLVEAVGSMASWLPGQVRRAIYHLPTSPKLTGNEAVLSITVIEPKRDQASPVDLTAVSLEQRNRVYDIPNIPQRLNVNFGQPEGLTLLGHNSFVTSVSQGETVDVTLYWQAITTMSTDYTVFVQLLDADQQIVAQRDHAPLSGGAPTTTWLANEVLVDSYTLSLPDVPAGIYRLIVGLYNPQTGQRMPLTLGGDFVELGTVEVQ